MDAAIDLRDVRDKTAVLYLPPGYTEPNWHLFVTDRPVKTLRDIGAVLPRCHVPSGSRFMVRHREGAWVWAHDAAADPDINAYLAFCPISKLYQATVRC